MATKKVLVNLDFGGNQVINVRAEVAASAPASGTPGRFYFNSTQQKLYIYTTNGWQQVGSDLPSNIVTGSGLTADKVVLGNGSSGVKTSSFTIAASVPPRAHFTDQNVLQTQATSANVELPVLLSVKPYTGPITDGTLLDAALTYNPLTQYLTMKRLMVHETVTTDRGDLALVSYVDSQDQKLADRISSISGFGRYLSGWDMATGEPTSLPTTATYTLQSGDYFIISNVPSSGTKYKPNQTGTWAVSQPFAKTTTNESCVVGGYWKFDGSTWSYFAPESAVTLPSFTNSSRGVLIGLQSSGYVYHDPDDPEGRAKVYGWDGKADTSTSHTITISGDATGSGSHTNASGSDATISVTIANGAVTTVKINDGAVTTAKIKAKWTGVYIAASQTDSGPYWQATGSANEYKAVIGGVTRDGSVRLCESNGGSFDGAKEVECVMEYNEDETGIYSATAYINSATAPTAGQYYFHCRKEAD